MLVVVLLGSAVRLVYGWKFRPWQEAPDQQAWQLLVDEARSGGGLRYDQFIHFPHEGGTTLSSCVAFVMGKVGRFPGLSLAALLLDSLSRLMQLWVVRRHLHARAFWTFAVWTIFGLPFLLPWGTVNYGLHSLAAFVPFVLLHFMLVPLPDWRRSMGQGAAAALCIWFCYDSFVLMPVFVAAMLLRKGSWWPRLAFLPAMAAVLALHLLVRQHTDAGFHLQAFSGLSVRGIHWAEWGKDYTRLWIQLWESLPNAMGIEQTLLMLFVLAVMLGSLGSSMAMFRTVEGKPFFVSMLLLVSFLLAYALSPFYFGEAVKPHYASYRHWAFALPLFIMLTIGTSTLRKGTSIFSAIFLACVAVGTVNFFLLPASEGTHWRESGYVLGSKLGHDPARLSRIALANANQQQDLLLGFGWGMTQAVLVPPASGEKQMDQLMELIHQFPPEQQRQVEQGLVYAFSEWTNPRLPLEKLNQFRARYPELQAVPVVR
jgi:hypothetical protein